MLPRGMLVPCPAADGPGDKAGSPPPLGQQSRWADCVPPTHPPPLADPGDHRPPASRWGLSLKPRAHTGPRPQGPGPPNCAPPVRLMADWRLALDGAHFRNSSHVRASRAAWRPGTEAFTLALRKSLLLPFLLITPLNLPSPVWGQWWHQWSVDRHRRSPGCLPPARC